MVLVLASLAAQAEAAGRNGPLEVRYDVRHWTTEQGLPQSSARALAQTPDGYLWIGTLAGLARFDGVRFTVFDKSNTPGLVSDTINSLGVDAAGTLWIGTADGLIEWRGGVVRRWTTADGLPTKEVYDVIPEAGVGIWWRCREHICLLAAAEDRRAPKRGSFSRYGEAHGVTNEVRSMHAHPAGGLLALTRHGALRLPGDGRPVEPMIRWPQPSDYSQAQADEQGQVWLCDGQVLHRFEEDRWVLVADWTIPNGYRSQNLFRDRAGAFWMSSANYGLWRWQAGRFARVHLPESTPAAGLETRAPARGSPEPQQPPTPRTPESSVPLPVGALGRGIAAMLEDAEGNIWIGAGGNGLLQLRQLPITTLTTADGLPDDETWSVSVGPDDSVWAGTRNGLARIHNGEVETFQSRELGRGFGASPVFADSWGNVWLAKGQRGVYCFTNGVFGQVPPAAVPNGFVGVFYEDRQRRLWLECHQQIIIRERDGRFAAMFTNDLGAGVRAMLEDRNGNFWFGTQGKGVVRWNVGAKGNALTPALSHPMGEGIQRLSGGTFTRFTTTDGLASDNVWALYEDADGVIWIGGQTGLTRFKDGRFFACTTAHGLVEASVNHIEEDGCGHLWLSGLKGLHRIARADLERVTQGRTNQVCCLTFGAADGMASAETNGGRQPAGGKTSDGRLWFPSGHGVVVVDPGKIPTRESGPPVVIEQIKAGEKDVDVPTPNSDHRNLRFGPGRGRVLEIRYTANGFSAPEKVQFRYKLEPRDQTWHPVGAQRFVFLHSLRPGSYTFRLAACNHHGAWNETGASFAFSLAPHFYETWPFYFVSGALALLAGLGLHSQRVRGLHRIQRLEQQRVLEQERARIARDLHDDLGASLTGVALQLEAAQRHGRAEGDQLAALAGETRSLAHELRELAWTTNPRCDNTVSLAAFIGEVAERFSQAAGLECKLNLAAGSNSQVVPARMRHELLVVLKESLANVATHAHARRVAVALSQANGEAHLVIEDDGRGFDPARVAAGNGLSNLRERIQQLGGSFTVASQPGRRTTVTAQLPLQNTTHS
jgi:signal transduction histidine kinase/ligand-binding sensor domain-containing protein